MNTNDILIQMRQDGINPPDLIPDEKIHRFKVDGSDHKLSGWYKGFRNQTKSGEDFFVFVYGDHHLGKTLTASSGMKLDKHNKAWIEEQIRKAKRAHHLETEELQKKAAIEANKKWDSLNDELGKNEYLEKKGLTELFGARIDGWDLVVPMRDIDGRIQNLERIVQDGKIKKGLYGGKRIGLFHTIGVLKDVVYIAEGFSTAASIFLALDSGVICTYNAANLPVVASLIAKKYPNKKIVICGDNDQYPNKLGEIDNVGRTKAEEAANLSGGKFVLPDFDNDESRGTDYNDLHLLRGLDAVRSQILAINPLVAVEQFDSAYVVTHPYPDENPENFSRRGTMQNVAELLRRLKVTVRYNLISKEEEIIIPGLSTIMDNHLNTCFAYVIDWCVRCKIAHSDLKTYITAMAAMNPYNPVVTWIESRPWDGVSRLKDLCDTIAVKNEIELATNQMKEEFIRKWLISAVAGAFEPNGVSAHGVLVLQGDQYMGKTAWFKRLVPAELNVIADGQFLRPDDKDSVFQVISKWLVELGELDGTLNKNDTAQLKAFLTKDHDVLRRPYAIKDSNYARRTVFFGSVNGSDFLSDPTGNRRFWILECENIRYDHDIDMQQLWAEIRELHKSGEKWVLSNEWVRNLNVHNENFETQNPIEERLQDAIDWRLPCTEFMSTAAICIKLGIIDPRDRHTRMATKALRKIKKMKPDGWDRNSTGQRGFVIPPFKISL